MKPKTEKTKSTESGFDISKFKTQSSDRYKKHIALLQQQKKQTDCIEKAVTDAISNINQNNTRSFVIYGEPQSGKTEMMIALTAKLLDSGYKIIIHLLNDSVDLLNQNLIRFKKSGLAPAPKNYKEILDPEVKIADNEFVIFCKKNSGDLQRLLDKLGHIDNKIIIDDEADYASPNSKVNRGEKTRINELIESLISESGIYIGVTATPARLDLNNTFENDHEKWVNFPPHSKYTGQQVFFPLDPTSFGFKLELLPDTQDSPKYIKEALFRFIINVAYLNKFVNSKEENYSMLIHTSGNKADHKTDKQVIESILGELSNESEKKYEKHVEAIWKLAQKPYPGKQDEITQYIVENRTRVDVVIVNSESDANLENAANPISLFTIVIGGNIVSRGVTFNNLLSMFFTRDVKHKIQQDTYIQRARMFGARGDYLKFFELTIPSALYGDWHRCFLFHQLAIAAIKNGQGAPVWISDRRISPVSATSIDRATVSLDKGEMSFSLFNFNQSIAESYQRIVEGRADNLTKLTDIKTLLGEGVLPDFLLEYIERTSFKGSKSIAIHPASSIAGYKDEPGIDKKNIERVKGFFGNNQMQKDKYPDAAHHFKIFFNGEGKARLFYKFDGSIQFLKNLKKLL